MVFPGGCTNLHSDKSGRFLFSLSSYFLSLSLPSVYLLSQPRLRTRYLTAKRNQFTGPCPTPSAAGGWDGKPPSTIWVPKRSRGDTQKLPPGKPHGRASVGTQAASHCWRKDPPPHIEGGLIQPPPSGANQPGQGRTTAGAQPFPEGSVRYLFPRAPFG